jgi:hypothetical protein
MVGIEHILQRQKQRQRQTDTKSQTTLNFEKWNEYSLRIEHCRLS